MHVCRECGNSTTNTIITKVHICNDCIDKNIISSEEALKDVEYFVTYDEIRSIVPIFNRSYREK